MSRAAKPEAPHDLKSTLRYITDESGAKTAVIVPIDTFENLLEDLEDLATIAERRDEPTMSHRDLMAELKRAGLRVKDVRCTDDELIVSIADGRTLSVPLAWYPRLLDATPEQRARWEIAGAGFGIHGPDIDEDLSTEGLLAGAPAPRGRAAAHAQCRGGAGLVTLFCPGAPRPAPGAVDSQLAVSPALTAASFPGVKT